MPRLTWFFVAGFVQAHFALIVPLVPLADILPATLGALAVSSMALVVLLAAGNVLCSAGAFLGQSTDNCEDTVDRGALVCGPQRLKAMVAKAWGLLSRTGPMD